MVQCSMSVILEIKGHMITVCVWKLVRSLARNASDQLFLSDLTKSSPTTGSCHSHQHASRSVLTSTLNTWPPIWCTMYYHIAGIFHRAKFSEGKILQSHNFYKLIFHKLNFRGKQDFTKLEVSWLVCTRSACNTFVKLWSVVMDALVGRMHSLVAWTTLASRSGLSHTRPGTDSTRLNWESEWTIWVESS